MSLWSICYEPVYYVDLNWLRDSPTASCYLRDKPVINFQYLMSPS